MGAPRQGSQLTGRELQVLEKMATGLTAKQAGDQLFLSEDTVKTHLKRVYALLGVRNVAHAITVAHELGFLPMACGAPECEPASAEPQRARYKGGRAGVRGAANGRKHSKPLPADLAERFPSTTWGEDEWFHVLQQDNDLFFRILAGIGKAPVRRRVA